MRLYMHPRSEWFRETFFCARMDSFHGFRWCYFVKWKIIRPDWPWFRRADPHSDRFAINLAVNLWKLRFRCILALSYTRSSQVRYEVRSLPSSSATCESWEDCKIPSGARAFLWNSRCGSRERSRARSPLPGRVCLDDSGGLDVSRAPEFSSISI